MAFAYPDLTPWKVYKKLLCHWIFPDSLDSIFTSLEFWKFVLNNETNHTLSVTKWEEFSLLWYKLTRSNNVPRYMGIPHPLGYIRLARIIRDHWDDIDEKIWKSNPNYRDISKIIPSDKDDGRLVVLWTKYEKRLVLTGEPRENPYKHFSRTLGVKYVAKTDISWCFHNIYSHSLGWAILSKARCKVSRRGWWHNDIDMYSRALKNNETNWLPIWPDTSHILSEIILSQIDKNLVKKWYSYTRYIDDYSCYCESREKAETFIKDLISELEHFQLKLNEKKTHIVEMPETTNDDWVRKLRNYQFPTAPFSSTIICDYLDLAVDLSRKKWDFSPFRYAVKRITDFTYRGYENNLEVFSYIASITILHPYLIDTLDDLFLNLIVNWLSEETVSIEYMAQFLEKMLLEHTQYNRSDTVVFCLYFACKYNILLLNFESQLSKKILDMWDPLSALLWFIYAKDRWFNLDIYFDLLTKIDQQEWWLYVYELYKYSQTEVESRLAEIRYEDFYELLSGQDISFIRNDWSDNYNKQVEDRRNELTENALDMEDLF